MEFWIFWKKGRGRSSFRKTRAIVLKLHMNIHQGTLVLNLAKIDWRIQIFSDFEFFENFFKIVELRQISIYRAEILCVNALILIFDIKFYKNRWRPLNFRLIWFFNFFLSGHQIIKIRCIHEDFSVRKPKSSNLKKELREIGEEAIWHSRFTSFLYKNTSGIAVLAILNVRYGECRIFGSEIYENMPVFSKTHNWISACNYNKKIGMYKNVSAIAVFTALIITITTINNYIIVIIITIILMKNSNNNISRKKRKKSCLPTVPKSLRSRLTSVWRFKLMSPSWDLQVSYLSI